MNDCAKKKKRDSANVNCDELRKNVEDKKLLDYSLSESDEYRSDGRLNGNDYRRGNRHFSSSRSSGGRR